jgi:hypothetical protein
MTPRDFAVRRAILAVFADGHVPTHAGIGASLSLSIDDVRASYAALTAAHVIVPDAVGEVWMAMPFSAVPTHFRVMAKGRAVWANCAWDAFGVAAALDCDVSFATPCPASGAPLSAGVRRGVAYGDGGTVARIGVPAARWWDDIGFT